MPTKKPEQKISMKASKLSEREWSLEELIMKAQVEAISGIDGDHQANFEYKGGEYLVIYIERLRILNHYKNGKLHRIGGPALEVIGVKDGDQEECIRRAQNKDGSYTLELWCEEGQDHRVGGPAEVRSDGTKIYKEHGRLHRIDGPAVESPNPRKCQWFLDGVQYKKADHPFNVAKVLTKTVHSTKVARGLKKGASLKERASDIDIGSKASKVRL